MEKYTFFVQSLPIIFIIHDFEEVIGIMPWFQHNKFYIKQRFPKLSQKLLPYLISTNTSKFAVSVLIMLLIITSATYISIWKSFFELWMGLFMAYSIHILIHLIQWIIFKRYIPAIITSFFSIPYCAYGIYLIINNFNILHIVLWTVLGVILMCIILPLSHKLTNKLTFLNS